MHDPTPIRAPEPPYTVESFAVEPPERSAPDAVHFGAQIDAHTLQLQRMIDEEHDLSAQIGASWAMTKVLLAQGDALLRAGRHLGDSPGRRLARQWQLVRFIEDQFQRLIDSGRAWTSLAAAVHGFWTDEVLVLVDVEQATGAAISRTEQLARSLPALETHRAYLIARSEQLQEATDRQQMERTDARRARLETAMRRLAAATP